MHLTNPILNAMSDNYCTCSKRQYIIFQKTLYIASTPQDGRQTDNMVLVLSGMLYHGNLFEPIIFRSDSDLIFFLSDSRLNTDMIQNFWAIT